MAVTLAASDPFVHIWAAVNAAFGIPLGIGAWLKVAMLTAFGLPAFAVLGATIPVAVAHLGLSGARSGLAMAVASFGNCLGFLLAVLVTQERLPPGWAEAVPPLLAAAGAFVAGGGIAAMAATAAVAVVPWAWPSTLLEFSYANLMTPSLIRSMERMLVGSERLAWRDTAVSIVAVEGGRRLLVINGYLSLVVDEDGRSDLRETVFGAMPARFSRNTGKALVLGLGTGITAAATAAVYPDTRVVEINPLMTQVARRFTAENMNVLDRLGDGRLAIADGLTVQAIGSGTRGIGVDAVRRLFPGQSRVRLLGAAGGGAAGHGVGSGHRPPLRPPLLAAGDCGRGLAGFRRHAAAERHRDMGMGAGAGGDRAYAARFRLPGLALPRRRGAAGHGASAAAGQRGVPRAADRRRRRRRRRCRAGRCSLLGQHRRRRRRLGGGRFPADPLAGHLRHPAGAGGALGRGGAGGAGRVIPPCLGLVVVPNGRKYSSSRLGSVAFLDHKGWARVCGYAVLFYGGEVCQNHCELRLVRSNIGALLMGRLCSMLRI
jgi:hypothetical protein